MEACASAGRHCEAQSAEAIHIFMHLGLLRYALNGACLAELYENAVISTLCLKSTETQTCK
jgi:hypothetical protein